MNEHLNFSNSNVEYEIVFNKEILFKIKNKSSDINWSSFFNKLDLQLENLKIKNYSIKRIINYSPGIL